MSKQSWIASMFIRHWGRLLASFGFSTLSVAAVSIDPFLLGHLIDDALPHRNFALALGLMCAIAFCYIARLVFYGFGTLATLSAVQTCAFGLRVAITEKMFLHSVEYHEGVAGGERIRRIEPDVDAIAEVGVDLVTVGGRSVAYFAMNVWAVCTFGGRIIVMIVPLLPLFAYVQGHYRKVIRARAEEARESAGASSSFVYEMIAGIPQIIFLGACDLVMEAVKGSWKKTLAAQWRERTAEAKLGFCVSGIIVIAIAIVLGVCSNNVVRGRMTIGMLVMVYAYTTRLFEPIGTTMDLYARSQRVRPSVSRIYEVIATTPSVLDRGTLHETEDESTEGFVISGVSFGYRGKTEILKNISLSAHFGETIGIAGPSGAGKSTLARLLVRASDPTSGSIYLDGRDIRDYTLDSLRERVCYVPQDPVLFSGSIRDNLRYANPEVKDFEILEALECSRFTSTLQRLPQGLDTILAERGQSLSGGERQRLAIARALIRSSPILILDESTSALDVLTEAEVLRNLASFPAIKLLFVITHRVQTLTGMSRIIMMQQGYITASGTHQCLFDSCDTYREFLHAAASDKHA